MGVYPLKPTFPIGKYAEGVPSHPYIRTILDTCDGAEWDDTSRARGIYFMFARLASEVGSDQISSLNSYILGVRKNSLSAFCFEF